MSAAAAALRRVRALAPWLSEGDRAAAALCLGFVAVLTPLLASLAHNYDEGVYIQQAMLVLDGWLPYRDFFCHQTPLHLFTLAAFAWPDPDSLFLYRLPSLLATATGGFFVYRIARELMPKPAAVAAALLSLTTTVQFYGLVALPNALMTTCSSGAVLLGLFGRGRRSSAAAGVLVALAVLYKPLAVASGAAVGLAMLLDAQRRRQVPIFVAAGAATGVLAFVAFDLTSDGAFRALLALQLERYSGKSGFETMQAIAAWREIIAARGVESALGWNWDQHLQAFHPFRHRNTTGWVAALAALGALALLVAPRQAERRGRAMLLLWWALPFAACIWLWEPIWDHYLIQYVPPMAVLGALALSRLPERGMGRGLAALVLAAITCVAALHVSGRRPPRSLPLYASFTQQRWLTFDPFINFITRTQPACNLIDPFNVYGPNSLTAGADGPAGRFHVSSEEIIACLEWDPKIRVGIGYWGDFFVDETLRDYLLGLPAERFLPASFYGPDDGRIKGRLER